MSRASTTAPRFHAEAADHAISADRVGQPDANALEELPTAPQVRPRTRNRTISGQGVAQSIFPIRAGTALRLAGQPVPRRMPTACVALQNDKGVASRTVWPPPRNQPFFEAGVRLLRESPHGCAKPYIVAQVCRIPHAKRGTPHGNRAFEEELRKIECEPEKTERGIEARWRRWKTQDPET